MACLALFWLTRWGRSEVDCRATNDAMTAVALARSLNEERAALRSQLAQSETDRDRLASMVQRFTQLAHETSGRGNGAIASHSHTGNRFAGAWGGGWSLTWQAQPQHVVGAVGCCPAPVPALPPELAALSVARSAGRGSPAGTPPTERSARCRASERSPPPQPSTPREVALSLPLEPLSGDAEVTPLWHHIPDPSDKLLELRQAPRRCARARARATAGAEPGDAPDKSASQGTQAPMASPAPTPPASGTCDVHTALRGLPDDGASGHLGLSPRSPPRSAFATIAASLTSQPRTTP